MDHTSPLQKQYLRKLRSERRRVLFFRIFLAVAFLCLWETAARLEWIDSFFFSSPSKVASTFLSMWKDGSIFLHVGITLSETLISFFLVVVLGLAAALILWLCTPI